MLLLVVSMGYGVVMPVIGGVSKKRVLGLGSACPRAAGPGLDRGAGRGAAR